VGYVTDLQRKSHISPWEQRYSQNKHAQCGFGLTYGQTIIDKYLRLSFVKNMEKWFSLAFIYIIRKTISFKKIIIYVGMSII